MLLIQDRDESPVFSREDVKNPAEFCILLRKCPRERKKTFRIGPV